MVSTINRHGLNFSLGNFLGTSELDILRLEVISGASGPFYGPNAFNGVISQETKDPFIHTGLTAMVRAGERNLLEGALRYAHIVKNKNGMRSLHISSTYMASRRKTG
jgi:hypothetical protein